MARQFTVAAEPRATRGKNEARRLRERGLIPAVVYGAMKTPIAVAVSPKEVQRILHSASGHNTIFDVAVRDGETTPAMLVDFQMDPVKESLLHVDLKRIDLTKKIKVMVPIVTMGEARGVKIEGGLLEVVTRELEVECLPDDIPERFTVDVRDLGVGQSIRTGDIAMPDTVKLVSAPDNVVAHVITIREEAAPAAAAPEAVEGAPAAAAASEPEVIKKGKKEEEAAEDGEKKKK